MHATQGPGAAAEADIDLCDAGIQAVGRHLWARGYFAVSSGTITDKMVKEYIAEKEGEPLHDDSRFRIDDRPNLPPSRR